MGIAQVDETLETKKRGDVFIIGKCDKGGREII